MTADMETEEVKELYNSNPEAEWERLLRHPIEFEINRYYMDRYIKNGDRVLDVGGGPGRYSLYLAGKSCDVTLLDLSDENIKFARQKAAEQNLPLKAQCGDARAADQLVKGCFDHVLLMGPLYHLPHEQDQIMAVDACLRLLKPGGLLFASFISSYANALYYVQEKPEAILDVKAHSELLSFIQDLPFSGKAFTNVYFAKSRDITPFMNQFSVSKLHLLSSESMLGPFEENLKTQSQATLDAWIDLGIQVCEREDILGYAQHFLYVGRKK